ncbi:acyl-CoA dehydrogenase family protein [Aquamicrobium sp. LC103]|uniref:acyl-CoA dehydrogenase family protein n=1 Tax=Aquamicrobium sp. LC103 TaxID=1120658 RepID=UPI00063ED2EF|nr:acyl-CoA dehydrogenase family protein [Aquamicrobium sp. LC103]
MTSETDSLAPADFAEAAKASIAASTELAMADVATRLAQDGIAGMLASEDAGGLGLPVRYAVPVLAAAGEALFPFPLIETLLAARALDACGSGSAAGVITGETVATIAWGGAADVAREGDKITLNGVVSLAPHADKADLVLVALDNGEAVAVPTAGLSIAAAWGIDHERPCFEINLSGVEVDASCLIPAASWKELIEDALVSRAAVALGCAASCLAMAEEHANTRIQFGRALSANQAMRHMLARMKMHVENIRAVIDSGFSAANSSSPALRRKAAYLAAVSSGIFVVERAIQVHGGMGFTWEMPLHRHLRWLRSLQTQGDSDGLLLEVADDLIGSAAA